MIKRSIPRTVDLIRPLPSPDWKRGHSLSTRNVSFSRPPLPAQLTRYLSIFLPSSAKLLIAIMPIGATVFSLSNKISLGAITQFPHFIISATLLSVFCRERKSKTIITCRSFLHMPRYHARLSQPQLPCSRSPLPLLFCVQVPYRP